MAFNGYIFDNRNNTAKNWRAILAQVFPDGYLDGCEINITSGAVSIGSGRFIAGGGAIEVDGNQTLELGTPQLTNGYVRLKFVIDLSQAAESEAFAQGDAVFEYSTTETFPDLVQEAINGTGTKYEMEMGVFRIEGGNLTRIVRKMAYAGGFLQLAGGALSGNLTLGAGCRIKGTQYGTGKEMEIIWLGNSANDNIWIGGNDGEATIGGGIYFHIGEGKQMKLIRGTDASVELLDAGNFAPGACTATSTNGYSDGTHTHSISVTNSAQTPHQGTFYLSYDAQNHVARLAGYRDASKSADYAQLALANPETGSRVNSVNVYEDTVQIQKDLTAEGNFNANGAVNLFGEESRLNGKNYAGDTVRLIRMGINEYDNLWIGTGDASKEAVSHAGNTYISAGRGGKIYAVIKKTNADGTEYEVLHTGNASSQLGGTFAAKSHTHNSLDRADPDLRVGTSGDGAYFRTYKCDTNWSIRDNFTALGSSSARWKQLFAATSTISTSDARMKEEIADIDGAKELILKLKPRQFKRTDGESGRLHYGMVAQEVKEAMTAAGIGDFGGYVRSPIDDNGDPETAAEEDVRYGLRYEEFIAPLIATVQEQQKQIQGLTRRIEALEGGE